MLHTRQSAITSHLSTPNLLSDKDKAAEKDLKPFSPEALQAEETVSAASTRPSKTEIRLAQVVALPRQQACTRCFKPRPVADFDRDEFGNRRKLCRFCLASFRDAYADKKRKKNNEMEV